MDRVKVGGRGKDKRQRRMSPASIANLAAPIQIGEVRNPTGKNGRQQVYSDCYRITATAPVPESARAIINCMIRRKLVAILRGDDTLTGELRRRLREELKRDFIPSGMLWAQALSLRMHWEGLIEGNVAAVTEIADQVEGRPRQRIDIASNGQDRLKMLIAALDRARENAPEPPSPDSGAVN